MTRTATHRVQGNWTAEMDAILLRMVAEGKTHAMIARAISKLTGHEITRSACCGRANRLSQRLGVAPMPREVRAARRVNAATEGRLALRAKKTTPTPKVKKNTELYFGRGAERGAWNVTFNARTSEQCPRFVEGEEPIANGFVCGRPIAVGSFCATCAKECYQPVQKAKAA